MKSVIALRAMACAGRASRISLYVARGASEKYTMFAQFSGGVMPTKEEPSIFL